MKKYNWGLEVWWNDMMMSVKHHSIMMFIFVFGQVSISILISYFWYGRVWGLLIGYVSSGIGEPGFDSQLALDTLSLLLSKSIYIFILSTAVWLLYPVALRKFKNKGDDLLADKHISGAKLITPKELNDTIKKDGEKTRIRIGEINYPISAEHKHVLIIGRPGVGKTVSISQGIDTVKNGIGKGLIYDFKGDYLSKFYNPDTDLIFNFLDKRGLRWNLFNECEKQSDIEAISTSLIPPASGADSFWHNAARAVFVGLLYHLWKNNLKNNSHIWKAVTLPVSEKAEILKNTEGGEAGYSYMEDARLASNVNSVLMQFVACFRYMPDGDNDWSIKRWLQEGKGYIFVVNYADLQDTLKPILSLFIDLLGRKLLSLQDDLNRRVFFFVDEFGTLQKLPTLVNLLTLSRSKGGSVWLGIQDIGQIEKIYGKEIRQAIVNSCGSNVVFSVADPDTSEYLSRKIGEEEISRADQSISAGVEDGRDGLVLNRKNLTQKLIKGSDITNLKDLHCLVKIPNYHLSQTKLQWKKYEDKAESFVLRDGLNIDDIFIKQASVSHQAEGVWNKVREQEVEQQEQEKSEGKNTGDDTDLELNIL